LSASPVNGKKALLESDLTGSTTGGTGFNGFFGFCSGSVAVIADFPTRNFEFGFFAVYGFFKRNF